MHAHHLLCSFLYNKKLEVYYTFNFICIRTILKGDTINNVTKRVHLKMEEMVVQEIRKCDVLYTSANVPDQSQWYIVHVMGSIVI